MEMELNLHLNYNLLSYISCLLKGFPLTYLSCENLRSNEISNCMFANGLDGEQCQKSREIVQNKIKIFMIIFCLSYI